MTVASLTPCVGDPVQLRDGHTLLITKVVYTWKRMTVWTVKVHGRSKSVSIRHVQGSFLWTEL